MERKVYIHKNQINLVRSGELKEFTTTLNNTQGMVECVLEIPDRKATITEYELEEALKAEDIYLGSPGAVGRIRAKLFGERQ